MTASINSNLHELAASVDKKVYDWWSGSLIGLCLGSFFNPGSSKNCSIKPEKHINLLLINLQDWVKW